jgi:hypothetical protein
VDAVQLDADAFEVPLVEGGVLGRHRVVLPERMVAAVYQHWPGRVVAVVQILDEIRD